MASAAHGKVLAGMSCKPDDCWTVPLCDGCHTEQHSEGEMTFWARLDLAPVLLALKLFAASPDQDAMRAAVITAIKGRMQP